MLAISFVPIPDLLQLCVSPPHIVNSLGCERLRIVASNEGVTKINTNCHARFHDVLWISIHRALKRRRANDDGRNFHFISGLPRSRSTLLCALLNQTPLFSAAMTSPVVSLAASLMHKMSGVSEFAVFLNDERRRSVNGSQLSCTNRIS